MAVYISIGFRAERLCNINTCFFSPKDLEYTVKPFLYVLGLKTLLPHLPVENDTIYRQLIYVKLFYFFW